MDGLVAPASRPRLVLPRRRLQAAGDDRLVAQIRCGDGPASRNAFEVLYDRHHRGVLAFCRHMLGSPEEAEDAVQHTFSAAYRALLRDDRKIALRAWLYAIARNRCLSMLAARREQVALDDVDGVLPATTGLAQEVEQRDDLRELLADVQRLPEDQRAALVLAELEALSHKEIADILGVPPSKVKALVFQARESLMIRRQARDASCGEIREQLSVLRGGALRRRELRRHVESCEGCRMFEAEVRRQRAGMAVLLPVAPTLALKSSTLASAFTASSTSAAAGVGALAGGGAVAGGLAVGAKATGLKALAVLVVAGSAGGGGYAVVDEVAESRRAPAPAQTQRSPAPGQAQAPAAAPAVIAPAGPARAAGAGSRPSAASSSSATAAERAKQRSARRSPGAARGNSATARADKAARAAAKKRGAAGRKPVAASRGGPDSRARGAAAKAPGRAAQRRAADARRARALQEAPLRKPKADSAGAARRPADTPATAQSTATGAPHRSARRLDPAPAATLP